MLLVMAGGAFAAPTSKPAKPSASGGSNATIYFLRAMPVLGWANKPDVRLDGRVVGEISVGSYFVVSCPRGPHAIEVQGGLSGAYRSQLQCEGGKTYFIEIGPASMGAPGTDLFVRGMSGATWGQAMPGGGFNAAFAFYLLGDQEGRAKIATLKKIAR